MPPLPPLPPPPVWPLTVAEAKVRELNTRFRKGRASNEVEEAGVLLRQFDKLSSIDSGKPWLPCPKSHWCARYSKFWPASIINPFVRDLYYNTEAGLVIAPSATFLCAYPGDGNSMGASEHGCHDTQCTSKRHWDCHWPPEQLQQCLEQQQRTLLKNQHNEMVVDLESVTPLLPGSIEAFFFMDSSNCAMAHSVSDRFRKAYNLTTSEFPVVHLDLYGSSYEPFTISTSGCGR